jgi:hypothetical protein
MREQPTPLGIDSFWIEADYDGSSEHPLERELGHRLDVLTRYHSMISDALATGRDDVVDALLVQHDRQAEMVRQLRMALDRAKAGLD